MIVQTLIECQLSMFCTTDIFATKLGMWVYNQT